MRLEARGYAFIVLSAVSFGGVAVLGKLALATGASVASVLFWRWLVAAVALAPLAFALERPRLAPRALAAAFLLGFVGYVGTSGLYFLALPRIEAALASFLLFLNPVLVAALSALLLGERLDLRGGIALALAVAGLAFLTLGPDLDASATGVLLALGAAAVYAATIVAGRRVVRDAPPLTVAVVLMAGAAAGFGILGAVGGSLAALPSPEAWALVGTLAVVSTAVSIGAFYLALPLIGAPRAALASTLEPVSTVFVAAVVLDEWLRPMQVVGAVLVILAVVALAVKPKKAAA